MAKSLPSEETYQHTDSRSISVSKESKRRLLVRLRDTSRSLYWETYDRESAECVVCGRRNVPLEVHHRDGDPFNNHLINLVAVCHPCHKAEHARRCRRKRVSEWKKKIDELGE